MSLRDEILSCQDIQEKLIHIPQWGKDILVRGLTGDERANLLQNSIDKKGNVNYRDMYPRLVVMAARDPETKDLIFLEGDMDALAGKNGAALETIAKTAMELSGLNEGEAEKN